MQTGETMRDLVSAMKGYDLDAILLMCSSPESITAGLRDLRDAYDGHIGGYANIGYGGVGILGDRARQRYMALTNYGPARVAEVAREWQDIGATRHRRMLRHRPRAHPHDEPHPARPRTQRRSRRVGAFTPRTRPLQRPQPGIERVPKRVPEQVKSVHRQADRYAGEDREPRRALDQPRGPFL